MLTKRAFLLTAAGLLLTGNMAFGQTATTGADMLFWLLGGILIIVLLMVLIAGASLASATRQVRQHTASATNQSITEVEEGAPTC
ncbi:hypothetical protein GCM10011375_15900 [Hymenobacter qilianensis]|uniref:Uncharacterized protein n=2 Tax=Hymenobacter qilianensis TaxID=1385715 RepID=A0ACB5PQE7_9BACT|nr:hypothetical protein [Hymenobacter qilianensis]QNP51803.1 hypothetical protein H9L05_17915 [Hymenobacter qilianensis]GGF61626.1 hypothetical protein GCM10011375_15900 [Hymenobacter qilianensis]